MVEDLVKLFRTREDVRSMLPESLISELKSDLYSPIQPSSNAHEVQRATAKTPKSNLHCRACQNKFSSVEALENHNKKKTVNTGIHTNLPRSFKNDSTQIIVCQEPECCFSTTKLNQIYSHDRTNHAGKYFDGTIHKFNGEYQGGLLSVVTVIESLTEEKENFCS